jgi:Rrf2 family protein
MKLTAQEEYGLRCLLHLARHGVDESATIPEISSAEGLSVPNVAKLMRLLRIGGLVTSVRGQAGGYTLARGPREIPVSEALQVLGGEFFSPTFCDRHSGRQRECSHVTDCSLRAMWTAIQHSIQEVMSKTTLADLMCSETEMTAWVAEKGQVTLPILEKLRFGAPRPPS